MLKNSFISEINCEQDNNQFEFFSKWRIDMNATKIRGTKR